MNGTARLTGFVVLLGLLAGPGCLGDAPRGNPLDPRSDDFENVGRVAGQAVRFYPPHAPLGDVEVRLTPEGGGAGPFLARTGADGRFRFEDVPAGRYRLDAALEGFAAVVDTVTVAAGRSVERGALRLDGLPGVASLALRTVHVSRHWPQEDLYLLDVVVDAEDPDGLGDVASVRLLAPAGERALQATAVAGRYAASIPADSLGAASLHTLMGQPFAVVVRDHAGYTTTTAAKTLVRIIEQTPVPSTPQGLEPVADPRPTLAWEPAALPFPFTYRVDVVQVFDANIHTVVHTVEAIPSSATTLRVPAALGRGTYYWTLSVVDAFGNRSRSKEAGFLVE